MDFSKDILNLKCKDTADNIQTFIKNQVYYNFKKKGAVIGISGGIDSALTTALCVNALGA